MVNRVSLSGQRGCKYANETTGNKARPDGAPISVRKNIPANQACD